MKALPLCCLALGLLEAQLRDIHEVFAGCGIPFWLRDGTALGVVRDGGLTPYDDDADLGLWARSRPRLEDALAVLARRGFVVYKRTPRVIGLLRDWETTELCFSGTGEQADDYEQILEGFFRDLAPVRFLGCGFLVPADTERYLEFCYGPDWRIPRWDAWANTCWRPAPERQAQARTFARPAGGAGGDHA